MDLVLPAFSAVGVVDVDVVVVVVVVAVVMAVVIVSDVDRLVEVRSAYLRSVI